MAGSRRWFTYTDETNQAWAIERDETLTEAVNGEATLPEPGSDTLPRAIQPRYLRYNSATGTRSKSVVLLDNTAAALLAAPPIISVNDGDGLISLYLTSYQGERRRITTSTDTGLDDGDTEVSPGP